MAINVFGNSANWYDNGKKIDTSVFVQKLYLRTYYIESNIEDNDLKSQYRIKSLPDPISTSEPASKIYVDSSFSDPSIIKNTSHIDVNDRNTTNERFLQVNHLPQIDSHLTAKLYVGNAIDEKSLVGNMQDNDFNNHNVTNINSNTSNNQAVNDNQVITKPCEYQFHQANERSRRDIRWSFYDESSDLVINNQDNDLNDKKLTNLDSITVNRRPSTGIELANKKYIDDELDKNTVPRLNQTLQHYLKLSAGNKFYNLTKYDRIQTIDKTEVSFPNIGSDLLQKWNIECDIKNNQSRITDFIKSTKTTSPTGEAGATTLPPIVNSFMDKETSSSNSGNENVFVSCERTDSIQSSNITFYFNIFSILTNESKKSMDRFRIQLLLEDNTWSTRYDLPKNGRYSNSPTDWTLVNLNFTEDKYGVRISFDQIDKPHADMRFSNSTLTHSVF